MGEKLVVLTINEIAIKCTIMNYIISDTSTTRYVATAFEPHSNGYRRFLTAFEVHSS